ncbi:MAG: hypothetical protein ACLFPA_01485, partial [Dichotomicrobium sp.]
ARNDADRTRPIWSKCALELFPINRNHVMPVLDTGIHGRKLLSLFPDCRIKSGNDEGSTDSV